MKKMILLPLLMSGSALFGMDHLPLTLEKKQVRFEGIWYEVYDKNDRRQQVHTIPAESLESDNALEQFLEEAVSRGVTVTKHGEYKGYHSIVVDQGRFVSILVDEKGKADSQNVKKPKETRTVKNRKTHTVEGRRESLQLIVDRLDDYAQRMFEEAQWADTTLSLSAKGIETFLNTITNKNNYALFFEQLKNAVFAELGDIDPEVYQSVFDFTTDMQSYFIKFVNCTTDGEIKALLSEIETKKEKIIARFNQCAAVIMKIAEVSVKVAFNHCLLMIPTDARQYLPLASQAAQTALVSLSSVKGTLEDRLPSFDLQSLVTKIGRGYLSRTIGLVEQTGYIKLAPSIHRSVYFVERLAWIFFINRSQGRPLVLTYTPAEKRKFPLNDGYFIEKTFKDLCQNAYKGDLAIIECFAQTYPELLSTVDDNGQNLLGFAISGYCNGNDAVWDVFAYLLNQDLAVTKRSLDMLNAASTDNNPVKKVDRDARKREINETIALKTDFYKDNQDSFYDCPVEAPAAARTAAQHAAAQQEAQGGGTCSIS